MRSAFDAVLAGSREDRHASLAAACGGDPGLEREVAALLESRASAEAYLEELASRVGLGRAAWQGVVPPDLAGSWIGGYEVLRPLGRGGMATVYLARDPKHERQVALKILNPEVGASLGADRFLREIRLAARLQHPHILPVFDSGVSEGRLWFTMPFIEAGSLRDRLRRDEAFPVAEAVHLVREVALALHDAHRHGVVHRDVKPENILLTAAGEPLLADFGIARPVGPESAELTADGALLGTPAYMSPEQAEGAATVDGRTDLYSLGWVLYELLAHELPGAGATPRSVAATRLAGDAPDASILRAGVPPGVRRALARVLSRNPADRHQSGAEFARALDDAMGAPIPPRPRPLRRGRPTVRLVVALLVTAAAAGALGSGWLLWRADSPVARPAAASGPPRLAVLPFQNLGPPEDAYFAQGITDEITSHLATRSGLRVISRTSADRYGDGRKSLKEIGRELKVAYVLEGTVRWERPGRGGGAGSVRVTPQLIRVEDDTHLWAGHYHAQTVVSLLAVQTSIAERVAEALGVAIGDDQRAGPAGPGPDARSRDAVAYTEYLKGRHFWGQRTGESLRLAIGYFERAIEREPDFAAAQAGVAGASVVLPLFTNEEPSKAWRAARRAAEAALARDSSLGEAHAALGFGLMAYDWNWKAAESSFRRAIALNPNDATARHWFSALLGVTGRLDDALVELRRASELDPLSPAIGTDLGWLFYSLGRSQEAVAQLRQTIELDSLFAPAHGTLATVYLKRGDLDQAIVEAERAAVLSGGDAGRLGVLSHILAVAGRRAEADRVLAELERRAKSEFVPPSTIATAYLGRGDRARALAWLARAVEQRDALFVLDHHDPLYDPLRSDPAFVALLRRIGLGP